MKKYIKTIAMSLICIGSLIERTHAFAKQRDKPKFFVTIDIIVRDTSMLNDGLIQFEMNTMDINSSYTRKRDVHELKVNANKTRIVVPLSTAINYGRIHYEYKDQSKVGVKQPFNIGNNLFIFQTGDTLSIFLSKNKVDFLGNASEKYKLLYDLSAHEAISKPQRQKVETLFRNGTYKSYIKMLMSHQDSLYNVRRRVVENYRSRLNVDMYNLILADIWGIYNRKLVSAVFGGISIKDYDIFRRQAINETFEEYEQKFNSKILPDSVLVKSFRYCDFLIVKEKSKQEFYNSKRDPRERQSRFAYLYNSIISNYSGLVLDKVILLSFYIGKTDKSNINQFFDDAISKTTDAKYKALLTAHTKSLSTEAFPFVMPDKDGKMHALKDFKGKIVVLDFWYTGCPGCVGMGKSLKPIISDYKSNPNIVFISVSIDGIKAKRIWLKSLEDEIYSSKEEINLLAMEGKHSKIIRHYNILGYPKLIVISKEGEVVTTNPPDPRHDSILFRNFIDELL